ncbi:MAG: DegT/DnrJ/EryC1/StrS family aminotransferase [Candidatus Latescibacteria bacterium]|nr:DegT/DnrJ/EryC1/StrS family aminotransferase [Candidatus Latescibacterota bacterium]
MAHNYLPEQYRQTGAHAINHNYLRAQFSDYQEIFQKIEALVLEGDFTLGKSVDEFEARIRELTGSRFAVGVGSGTDALLLSLKAAGVGKGDEVITTPFTFFATIGAIVTAGARPVFVDICEDYNIDPNRIEKAIATNTKAILPVHWSGLPCEMDQILAVADRHGLSVIEDSCHAILAEYNSKPAGTFGLSGCFSMHPLKNLNVWGDGGYLVTDSEEMHNQLVLLRNHGLLNRDECAVFSYNSRLDSLQAIVANHLLEKIHYITESRIARAARFDELLRDIPQITIPPRPRHVRQVYHIYVVRAERRNELQVYLVERGIDAKVHYPIPMHLQPAASGYGYRRGDFPVCEAVCDSVLSLPVHEFIAFEQIEHVASKIREFYAAG